MTPSRIPPTLWHSDQILMPAWYADALRAELEHRNLFESACGPKPTAQIIGGQNPEDATEHFAHLFKTSSARVQYVMLNPTSCFQAIACDIWSFLLDGNVTILDIPSGSGGGLLGLLCTLA